MDRGLENRESITLVVPHADQGMRLDVFLTQMLTRYSRTFFQELIHTGYITLNGQPITKPSIKVMAEQVIVIQLPPALVTDKSAAAIDALGITLVGQHADFLVLYKPAGVLVHAPHPDTTQATVVDWLRHYYTDIATVGSLDRPGIVHRLDKDTSGLLLVALTNYAHMHFTQLFKERRIHKTYYALVDGQPPRSGTINFFIDRHPLHRHKMTHTLATGRAAQTHYTVLEYFDNASFLQLHPITGRTHQIRVHCAAIGHAIIGDTVYGKQSSLIGRHALHAGSLRFEYDAVHYEFVKDIPDDFMHALTALRARAL